MHKILVLIAEIVGGVSLLLNCYAFYAFIGKSKQRLDTTVTPVVLVLNVIFTICYTLQVSVPFVHNFCVVVVACGPVSSGRAGLALQVTCYLCWHASLLMVVNGFLKKYIMLCRSQYRFIYSSPKWLSVIVAANILVLIIWSFKYSWPADVGDDIRATVMSVTGLNLETHSHIGFCAEPNDSLNFLVNLTIVGTRATLLAASFYWAYKVKRKLSSSFLSERTKTLQRRFNNMLIGQTFCLAVLLQPISVAYPFLQYYRATSSLADIIPSLILVPLFPVCSSVVIIISLTSTNLFASKFFKQSAAFQIVKF